MTTKSRAADEPADETPAASQGVQESSQGQESTPVYQEALNPTGAPNEELPNAQPDASVEAVNEAGGEQVQAQFDEAAEKGYFGDSPDPTPREAYTLQGQAKNK